MLLGDLNTFPERVLREFDKRSKDLSFGDHVKGLCHGSTVHFV